MTVYIVYKYYRYEDTETLAVFDSEQKAIDYLYDNEPDNDAGFSLDYEAFQVQ